MEKYNASEIEKKWQGVWNKNGGDKAVDFLDKPKHYHLVEFPYPSGSGLHVGHCMGYTASDVYARMMRMRGYNVLFPIGWDAFGLPTENYAIKTGRKPSEVTKENTDIFRKQMKSLAYSFDWDREVNTTDPDYYKWTQWIFLQFYKHGYIDNKLVEIADDDTTTPRMAYQAEMAINWCPDCKIGLANEEVIDGKCERCGAQTYKKMQKQWMLRITAYADRLINDLAKTDYLEKIKTQQINWIGKSEGTQINFEIKNDFKDKNFVFLHAYGDNSQGSFWPWLKLEVEKRGGKVYVPDLPNTDEPNIQEQMNFVLDNYKFDENTVVVTHSLGGVVAMKMIPELKVKIDKLVMMATPLHTDLKDKMPRPALDACTDWKFDFEKIKENVRDIAILGDIEDHIVPLSHTREIAEKLSAKYFEKIGQMTHFNNDIEPEVLKVLLDYIQVFTTRADTLFGCTYVVLSPEHEAINNFQFSISNFQEVEEYINQAKKKSDLERTELQKEKTGVKLDGVKAINPINSEEVDVWVADYVLVGYGTGAVMAVPAHDERDFEFAKKYGIEIKEVITTKNKELGIMNNGESRAYTDYGVMINSSSFDGLTSEEGKKKVTEKLKKLGLGEETVNFKLRDWVFSRQHYWGEPIPLIFCNNCAKNKNKELGIMNNGENTIVPVPEDQLPLTLPDVENYEPTDTGESPLAGIADWVEVKCPKCGGKARRETDTMPNWAGSSWYYIAYALNQKEKIKDKKQANIFYENKKELDYWMPVDIYNGGMEHVTLHLLYSRFWHKFMYDLGEVAIIEPYQKRIAHGIILGSDGQKMSKSEGNVVNPDEIVEKYGADTMRSYIMFIGPYDQESAWSMAGLQGVYRFIHRVWNNAGKVADVQDNKEFLSKLHKYIVSVTDDIENFRLNTYVAKLMEINNLIDKLDKISKEAWGLYLQLLSPAMPHLAEELWSKLGQAESIFVSNWPKAEDRYLVDEFVNVAVQINGKVRGIIKADMTASEDEVKGLAQADPIIAKWLEDKKITKIIYIKDKIISFVIQ